MNLKFVSELIYFASFYRMPSQHQGLNQFNNRPTKLHLNNRQNALSRGHAFEKQSMEENDF